MLLVQLGVLHVYLLAQNARVLTPLVCPAQWGTISQETLVYPVEITVHYVQTQLIVLAATLASTLQLRAHVSLVITSIQVVRSVRWAPA